MYSFAKITTILLYVFWIAKLWLGSFLKASMFFYFTIRVQTSACSTLLSPQYPPFLIVYFRLVKHFISVSSFSYSTPFVFMALTAGLTKKSGYNYFFQRIMLLVWENTDFFVLIWTKTSETAVLSISCLVRCLCCCF